MEPTGMIHYAKYNESPRLQRVLSYMLHGQPRTGREIINGADVNNVSVAACELRLNGVCAVEFAAAGSRNSFHDGWPLAHEEITAVHAVLCRYVVRAIRGHEAFAFRAFHGLPPLYRHLLQARR